MQTVAVLKMTPQPKNVKVQWLIKDKVTQWVPHRILYFFSQRLTKETLQSLRQLDFYLWKYMLAKITLTVDQNPAKHFFGIGSSIKSKPWRVQTEEVSIFFQQQVNHWLLSILHNDRVRFSTRYVCSVARLTQQHCQGGIKVDQADSNVVWLFVCERSVYRTKSTSGSTKNRRKIENIRWFPDFQALHGSWRSGSLR